MSILGTTFGGALFQQFGFSGLPYGSGGIPIAQLTNQPVATPDQPAEPQKAIDRTTHFSFAAAASKYPGFDDAPPASLEVLWQMRRYATITLAFAITTGPVLAGKLIVKARPRPQPPQPKQPPRLPGQPFRAPPPDPKKEASDLELETWRQAVEEHCLPFAQRAVEPACESLNFGAWIQEIVWDRVDGLTVPAKARSFLPGEVTVYQDPYREFAGFQIGTQYRDSRYAFLCVCQPHLDPIFGYPRNLHCRTEWWRALKSNENADKTERKASGIQMMLEVPQDGTWKGPDGRPITAAAIAQKYADFAASGFTWTVPRLYFSPEQVAQKPELAQIPVVKAQPFDWGNPGPALLSHIARLDRLDRDIMRAWRRPEREAMEGQNGTKAEAGVHGQVGVNDSEMVGAFICRQLSEQVVDRFLVTNFGPDARGRVAIELAPLSDPQQAFLQQLATTIAGGASAADLLAHVDDRGLADKLEIPLREADDVEAEQAQQEQQQAEQQKAQLDALKKGPAGPNGQQNGNGNGNGNGGGRGPNGQNGKPNGNGNGNGRGVGLSHDVGGRLRHLPRLHRRDRDKVLTAARLDVTRSVPEMVRSAVVAALAGEQMHLFGGGGGRQTHMSDEAEGRWVTIDGAHVFIKGGVIQKGPAHLQGKSISEVANNKSIDARHASQRADEHGQASDHHEARAAHEAAAQTHGEAAAAHEAEGNTKEAKQHRTAAAGHRGSAAHHERGAKIAETRETAGRAAMAATEKATASNTPEDHQAAAVAHREAARLHEPGSDGRAMHLGHAAQHDQAAKAGLADPVGPAKKQAAAEATKAAEQHDASLGGKERDAESARLHRIAEAAHDKVAVAYHLQGNNAANLTAQQRTAIDQGYERHSDATQHHGNIANEIEGRPLRAKAKELSEAAYRASETANAKNTAATHQAAAQAHRDAKEAHDKAFRASAYPPSTERVNAGLARNQHELIAKGHQNTAERLTREPIDRARAETAVKKITDAAAPHDKKIAELDAKIKELKAANLQAWHDTHEAGKPDHEALQAHLEAGKEYSAFKKSPAHQAAVDRANATQDAVTAHIVKLDALKGERQKAIFEALTGHRPHDPRAFPVKVEKKPKTFDQMQPGIEAFQRLVGPHAKTSPQNRYAGHESVFTTQGRGSSYRGRSYSTGNGVFMSGNAGPATVVHELGHVLEHSDPEVYRRAKEFLDRRTAGAKTQSLKSMTGGGYGRSEKAKAGGFIDPYVGKIYDHASTEVVSMGLEHMYRDPVNFHQKDPEHFNLIHGIMHLHDPIE